MENNLVERIRDLKREEAPDEEAPDEEAPASRVPRPGSGVRAPSRSSQLMRLVRSADGKGLGPGAIIVILLVAAIAGAAVMLRLTRQAPSEAQAPSSPHAAAVQDAASPSEIPRASGSGTAGSNTGSSRSEKPNVVGQPEVITGAAGPDATAVVASADAGAGSNSAGAPGGDAGVPVAVAGAQAANPAGASGGSDKADKIAEAKSLYDKAHDALDEGDSQRAFDLAEASLKLRRTARTYLLRAQAQQRLDRVPEALASVDAAAQIAPDYSAVWEMRGKILWAVGRRDEARVAFEKFLALEPSGAKAAAIQRLLNEPR